MTNDSAPRESVGQKPITASEAHQFQRELLRIAKPFIKAIADVYARSLPTILVRRGEWPTVTYSPGTEAIVQGYREQMDAAIKSYLRTKGIEL